MAGGVLPVFKHVPGHGRARADSHPELPVVETSREELERADFAPFRANADLPLAMTRTWCLRRSILRALRPVAGRRIADHPRAYRLRRAADERRPVDEGPVGFRERTEALFAAGVDMALHCNGDLAEAEEVAAAARNWPEGPPNGRSRRLRASPATAIAFDPVDSRAKLDAALATQT